MNIPHPESLLRKYALGLCNQEEKLLVDSYLEYNNSARQKLLLFQQIYGPVTKVNTDQHTLEITSKEFELKAIEIFKIQARQNQVFSKYLSAIHYDIEQAKTLSELRFLPIELFKSHEIKTGSWLEETIFESSGTSHSIRSKHYIRALKDYQNSSWLNFNELVLNKLKLNSSKLKILALLPGYYNNPNSSLIHMINNFGKKINGTTDKLYYTDFEALDNNLHKLIDEDHTVILFGVSFALIDFATQFPIHSSNLIIIETGGMKTDNRDYTKSEILDHIQSGFPNSIIISEYGMTEMLSQAYALDGMSYKPSVHLKILITNIDDPFEFIPNGKRGRINVIDLANLHSCCFIQTDDFGILYENGNFEVIGRIRDSEIRGCNLMYDYQN